MRFVRTAIAAAAAAALTAGLALAAPASAAPAPEFTPTTAQLTKWGFTVTPNVSAWGGTATIAPATGVAPAGGNMVIQGTAPKSMKPGTKLQLMRFYPSNKKGEGVFKQIGAGIFATVSSSRTFLLHFQLSMPGAWGYALNGIDSKGNNRVIEFQLRTT